MLNNLLFKRSNLVLFFTFILAACSSNTSTDQTSEENSKEDTTTTNNVNKVYVSLPSPLRVISLLKKSGSHYTEGVINPSENAKKYTTHFTRALNMGIYGTDLAYATLHNQTQVSINCLKANKLLADGLGIANVFSSNNLVTRFENNLGNKDSLMLVISDMYRESESYLKENDNPSVAILIFSGGWIEGLYIATKVYEKNKNPDITTRIAEQKLSLDNLITMLEDYKSQTEFSGLLKTLKEIQQVYEKVAVSYTEKDATVDEKTNVVTLNSESDFTINEEQLRTITEKIAAFRTQIINSN